MELSRIMAVLNPGENVAPDLSSYDAMVAKWRGTGAAPTRQVVEGKWAEIKAAQDAVAYKVQREEAYVEQGATVEALVYALWEMIVENDFTAANEIQAKRVAIKAQFPKS